MIIISSVPYFWLFLQEVLSSYEKEYDESIEDTHNPVQKITVVPQGCGDEAHLIEIGLDANGEQFQVQGRSGMPWMT